MYRGVGEHYPFAANYLIRCLEATGYQASCFERAARSPFILTFVKTGQAQPRHRALHRQAPARLQPARPHHLLPAAGARVLPDRAHRNRDQGSHGRLHRRHGQNPGRSQHQPGDRHRSAVHPARARAG